jgi:hypothetical protein
MDLIGRRANNVNRKVVPFARNSTQGLCPNWDIGMMEDRNNGFWGVSGRGYWKNRLLFELTPGVAR